MPVVSNGVEAYQGDQLLAEQRDTRLISDGLRRLGVDVTELDSNDQLSLALLGLGQVERAAAALRRDSELMESANRVRQSRGDATGDILDLDLIVFKLRLLIGGEHDGWVPSVGKNRILGRVQGSPYIKGGIGIPEQADPVSIGPAGPRTGTRVAVLDTKLYAHPALVGRFIGESVADFKQEPLSTQGHSTFVAGLIAQRAPAAELIVREVLDEEGTNANSWDVATAMAGLLDAGIAVLNMSLGCATIDREAPLSLRRAVERLTPSVVVVAAAGNNGAPESQSASAGLTPGIPMFPAAIDGVIGVGAYDAASGSRDPAPFSPDEPWVSLLAPGVRVRSTFLPGLVRLAQRGADGQLTVADPVDFGRPGYATWDGTSFAAANVTGAIAALADAGQLTAYEALGKLCKSASPDGEIFPAGRG